MKTDIGHIVFNIALENIAFYRDLLGFMGWGVLYEEPRMLGVGNERGASLWFGEPLKEANNDYDGLGMNHLGIAVTTQAEVDEVVAYLQERGIPALFETPRHRPEFSSSPDRTYYQVMFESPDRILFEVVYSGPLVK
jgi:catechol 2,3-dioxygenase-like lactoylglutathione lyase family enzyme